METSQAVLTPVEAPLTSSMMSRVSIAASGLLVAAVMALPSSPIGMYFGLPVVQTDYGTHTTLAEEILANGIFVTVVLSALVKPSLLLCMLPATCMLGASRWLGGTRHHLAYLVGAVVVPSVAILTWQYLFYFGSGERSAIVFAPFLVMGY